MLEERSILEVPVVPEEKIDGITVYEEEKLDSNYQVTGANQQQWSKLATLLDLSVVSLCGRGSW